MLRINNEYNGILGCKLRVRKLMFGVRYKRKHVIDTQSIFYLLNDQEKDLNKEIEKILLKSM